MNEIASLQGVPAATGTWESGAPHGGRLALHSILCGPSDGANSGKLDAGSDRVGFGQFMKSVQSGNVAIFLLTSRDVGLLSAGAWCPGPIERL